MRPSRLLPAFVLAAGLLACAPPIVTGGSGGSAGGGGSAAGGSASGGSGTGAPVGHCGGQRWIGTSATCTSIAGFTASPLFGAGAPPALAGYCAYDWSGPNAPTANDVATLTGSGPTDLGEDCPVIIPQSPTAADEASYEQALASSLRASLRSRVGSVADLQLATPATPPVRLVVVDTAPDALDGTTVPAGNDRHGDTLASVARDIACSPSGCHVEIGSALGMPWLDENTADTTSGGHVGRLSDVALAIHRALGAAGSRPLVINLSLGWEDLPGVSECDGADPAGAKGPTHAVYDVIQQARCAGALVIAAAGNDAGGPTPPGGMICPARWEALPLAACPSLPPRPVVHAAGGVDYAARPIVLTRPHGRPRIAADALGGVAWADADPVPAPLTGSSVAAAVTSAIASVVWAESPSLTAEQVMDIVLAGAAPTGDSADSCPAGAAGPCSVSVVGLCGALSALGTLPGVCPPPLPGASSSPALDPAAVAARDVVVAASSPTFAAFSSSFDPAALPRYAASSPALGGGVFPQPVVPVCPSCSLSYSTGSTIFYAYPTTTLSSSTLVVTTSTSTGTVAHGSMPVTATAAAPLGATLDAGTAYRFDLGGAGGTILRAYLTGYTDASGTTAVTQEILVPAASTM